MFRFKYEIYLQDGSVLTEFVEDICFVNGFVYAHGKTLSFYDIDYVIMKWVDVDELS